MNTNSKKSIDRTYSGAGCRRILMLFGLFAFTWLPTAAVNAALLLTSPPDCETIDPLPCRATDVVTVFRWTPSENPMVDSYRVIFSEDPDFNNEIFELPEPGDEKIMTPQVALKLDKTLANGNFFFSFTNYYWRVVALDQSGNLIEQGQQTFAFFYEQDSSGFTVITGLVKSDLNQAALVGARVEVSSVIHKDTKVTTNSIAETVFNGEYIVIALTTDSSGNPIPFPIEITSTKEGFQTTVAGDLEESEKVDGVITRDVAMKNDLPMSSSLRLDTPPNDSRPEPVTVFRWTRSDNPAVHSYRLIIAEYPDMTNNILELPEPGTVNSIIAPQVAVDFFGAEFLFFEGVPLHWRVIGLDQDGNPVEQSQQVFSFNFFTDDRGFTVISGLVASDKNAAGLAGARVAVLGEHAQTANAAVQTEFNGEFIAIALTTGDYQMNYERIPFPIEIISTKEGFQPTSVILQETDDLNKVVMLMRGEEDGETGPAFLRAGTLPAILHLLLRE